MVGFHICVFLCILQTSLEINHNKKEIEILTEKRIAELERMVSGLTEGEQISMKRLSEMEKSIYCQHNEISYLQERLRDVERERKIGKMENELPTTDAHYFDQNVSQNNTGFLDKSREFSDSAARAFKRSLFVPRSLRVTVPSFYVYMSANEVNPGMHHTLIFDHVITNVGNGYNRHTGIFFVLAAGTYVFSFSISPDSSAKIPVEFVRNSDVLGASATYAYGGYIHPAAMTVVVQLSIGDVCYMRTSSTVAPSGSIRSDAYSRSSFAGWFLA